MEVIGITGGIASGKSLVTKQLKLMGYQVIDTDEISHHILEDQGVINELTDIFGNEILEQGKVNRKALGNIIFRNKDKQLLLNKIIHPRVIDVVKKELHEVINDIVFVDVPLLYESGMESMMDKVIVISASLDTQILRLVNRDNIERDYAIDKINMQMPLQEKSKLADFIIDNNGSIEDTLKQLDFIIRRIKNEI